MRVTCIYSLCQLTGLPLCFFLMSHIQGNNCIRKHEQNKVADLTIKTASRSLLQNVNHTQACITHCVFPDPLHAAGRHRGGSMQAQSGDSILVQGDVEPAVDIEAGGEDLRAVAPHTACPSLPGRCCGTGATPEDVPMNTVLIIPEVSL